MKNQQARFACRWGLMAGFLVATFFGLRFGLAGGQGETDGHRLDGSKGAAAMAAAPHSGPPQSAASLQGVPQKLRLGVIDDSVPDTAEVRSFSGYVAVADRDWPVPGAIVQLKVADALLAESRTDEKGHFELSGSFKAAELEDERTHWVVASSFYLVDEVLPFDREERKPRLVVDASLIISGTVRGPHVNEWPFPKVSLRSGQGGAGQGSLPSMLAQKKGAFEFQLPVSVLPDTLTVVCDEHSSAPLREVIDPKGLRVELGDLVLTEGEALHGVVESSFPMANGTQYIAVFLEDKGADQGGPAGDSWRLIDGELCLYARMIPVANDGTFKVRGLSRRRYRLQLEVPGPIQVPMSSLESDHYLRVEMQDRLPSDPPVVLREWWSLVQVQLNAPVGQALPKQVLVHGSEHPQDRSYGEAQVDPDTGIFWFAVPPGQTLPVRLDFPKDYVSIPILLPAIEAQASHEISLVLQDDGKIRHDLSVQITLQDGSEKRTLQAAEVTPVLIAYVQDSEGDWIPAEHLQLEGLEDDWVVRNMQPGMHRLHLYGVSRSNLPLPYIEVDVQIGEQQPDPINLQLEVGGRVSIRMVDKHGEPVSAHLAEVVLLNREPPLEHYWKSQGKRDPGRSNYFLGRVKPNGQVEDLHALPAGRYLVRARDLSYKMYSLDQEFEIREGETTKVTLTCSVD